MPRLLAPIRTFGTILRSEVFDHHRCISSTAFFASVSFLAPACTAGKLNVCGAIDSFDWRPLAFPEVHCSAMSRNWLGVVDSHRLTKYCRVDVSKVLWVTAHRNGCTGNAGPPDETPSGPAALLALLIIIASPASDLFMAMNGADSGYMEFLESSNTAALALGKR